MKTTYEIVEITLQNGTKKYQPFRVDRKFFGTKKYPIIPKNESIYHRQFGIKYIFWGIDEMYKLQSTDHYLSTIEECEEYISEYKKWLSFEERLATNKFNHTIKSEKTIKIIE